MNKRAPGPERVLSEAAAYALMLVVVVIFASAFAGIRYMLDRMPALPFTAARLTIASIGMLAVGGLLRVGLPESRDVPRVAAAGLLGFSLYHIALNFGATTITAGQAAFVASTIPIWTAFASWRFLGEQIGWRQWLGLFVSVAGIAVMSLTPEDLAIARGSALVLLAATFAAANIVLQKGLLLRYRATGVAVWVCVLGSLPLIAWLPTQTATLHPLTGRDWTVLSYLGLVPISIGYWVSNFALKALPAFRTAQMLLLLPPIAALIAWLALGEVPTLRLLGGGLVVLVGVAVSVQRRTVRGSGSRSSEGGSHQSS